MQWQLTVRRLAADTNLKRIKIRRLAASVSSLCLLPNASALAEAAATQVPSCYLGIVHTVYGVCISSDSFPLHHSFGFII